MSRGHGAIQRRIIEVIDEQDKPLTTTKLAKLVHDTPEATPAQRVATSRAVNQLLREGHVVYLGFGSQVDPNWASKATARAVLQRRREIIAARTDRWAQEQLAEIDRIIAAFEAGKTDLRWAGNDPTKTLADIMAEMHALGLAR